jgi:chloramphenicol 3-O phosphotransferase
VGTDIVVLNGGSSSGKTSIAGCLQELLPEVWLRWSIDDLVDALPSGGRHDEATIEFAADGGVALGSGFRRAETAWVAGLAAMARAGIGVIVDDVFLSGSASQERLRAGLRGLHVLWVGVRCEPGVAAAREAARADRPAGMAASQAYVVHRGVGYDVEVDTTRTTPMQAARTILAAISAP